VDPSIRNDPVDPVAEDFFGDEAAANPDAGNLKFDYGDSLF
jgi:hypothetical protein